MALFQYSVLSTYLPRTNNGKVYETWNTFTTHFHNPDVNHNSLNIKTQTGLAIPIRPFLVISIDATTHAYRLAKT